MAFPTNKITEDFVRKLVSESKNPLNPLNMVFTYEHVSNIVQLNWNDMLFAIENNFLACQSAIEHALKIVQENENVPEEVWKLACMLQHEAEFTDVLQLVKRLATSQNNNDYFESREKFLFLSLNWVYEHWDNFDNPIEVIDILCDDKDYPDEVKNLCSFMPSSVPELYTSDSETKRLFDKLLQHLQTQRNRWV